MLDVSASRNTALLNSHEDELKEIAIKIAEKKNFTEKKIAENIGEFHHKWTTNEISKKSPQCFTIRDLNSTITSLKEIKPFEAILSFYGSRYEKNEREIMKKMIFDNFKDLYQEEIIFDLPENFPKSYHSLSVKRAFYYSKIAFDNGRHIIITGKQGDGLTQIAKWIAEYNSKDKKNFCFVFTPETSVSDLLGKYIPNSQIDSGAQLIEWKDGPLTNGIKNGFSGVFINIDVAQSKVIERLNPIIEPKEFDEVKYMNLQENANINQQIEIHKDFHFIGTCDSYYLDKLSPAFLNRLIVINIENQLEDLNNNEISEFIKIIIESEKIKIEFEKLLISKILQIYKKNKPNLSNFAKLIKSIVRYYTIFQDVDLDELIEYIQNIISDKNDFDIPITIQNKFLEMIEKKEQKSKDEKFYFKNSKNLVNLMINLYTCSIIRIPVCLVGSTGLGKTSMARAFSEIIKEDDHHIMFSFNMETQIDDLYGTFSFEQGKAIPIYGPIPNAIKNGKTFIADELNLAEDNILQSISVVLESSDEGTNVLIPGLGETFEYNKNFFFIACQNDIQTRGRRKLPEIIKKRLRIFEYPSPNEEDIKRSCEEISKNELELFESEKNPISITFPNKIARFMYLINEEKNQDIGIWSMRNIRKLFRRLKSQQIEPESYIQITPEHHVVFFILQSIIPEKRIEVLDKILAIMESAFDLENEEKEDIIYCIKSPPIIQKKNEQLFII